MLAILSAQQAYHRKNNWAQRTGTAVLAIANVLLLGGIDDNRSLTVPSRLIEQWT